MTAPGPAPSDASASELPFKDIAAVIGRECRLRGIVAPPWTTVPALRSWWFPDDDPILTARTMQRTPVDLQLKGIWLDGKALETL